MKQIQRREFLAALTGLVSASVARSEAMSDRPEGAAPWKIGCYTRPFDKFDYRVAFDAIAEAGYRYVGFMTTNTKGWVMVTPDTPEDTVVQMRDEATQRTLKVLSVYGVFSVADSVSLGVSQLKRLIDRCAICRSPDLLLAGIGEPGLYEAYYRAIAECCDYAAAKHVRLTIKPHGGTNATGSKCRQAIEQVGHANFKLWYDPGNIFYYSDGKLDPVNDAGTVDGLVAGMCVKDYRHPKDVMVTPGTGQVKFEEVFAKLKRGGFTHGPLLIECVKSNGLEATTIEARKALRFVERLCAPN